MNIKEIRDIKTNELSGYSIDYGTHKRSTNDLADEEVLAWIEAGNTPEPYKTDEELAEDEKQKQISDAMQYLKDTDYKMTLDYDKDTTEVKIKRAEAREVTRTLISDAN